MTGFETCRGIALLPDRVAERNPSRQQERRGQRLQFQSHNAQAVGAFVLAALAATSPAPSAAIAVTSANPPAFELAEFPELPGGAYGAVVVGDLGGDTAPDLAITEFPYGPRGDIGLVHVSINDGSERFTPPLTAEVGDTPTSIDIADLNEDARQDLVVANSLEADDPDRGSVQALLNSGSAGFAPQPPMTAGFYPTSTATGDFDGDSHQDVAVLDAVEAGQVSLLRGDGSGALAPPSSISGELPCPTDLEAGDLEGDGDLDLVASDVCADTVAVLVGDGHGGFLTRLFPAVAGREAGLADLDSDRRLDIVVLTNAGYETVRLLQTPDAGFAAPQSFSFGRDFFEFAELGDVNGDGAADLVVSGGGGVSDTVRLGTYLGTGSGGFGTRTILLGQAENAFFDHSEPLAVADINGDAKDDVVTIGDPRALYLTTDEGPRMCNGAEATVVGFDRPDQVEDNFDRAHEVFSLGGKSDLYTQYRGALVCGGAGRDALSGGPRGDFIFGGPSRDFLGGGGGNDALYGQGGRDTLNGGSGGRDVCDGGGGRDGVSANCEHVVSIP